MTDQLTKTGQIKKAYIPLLYMRKPIDVQTIISEVSKVMCIPSEIFLQQSRKREYTIARQLSMYLARKYTKQSLATIGMKIADKDHATVLHACRTIDALIDTNNDEVMRYYPFLVLRLDSINRDLVGLDPSEHQAENIFNTEK